MDRAAEEQPQERENHRARHPGGKKDEAEREQSPGQEARHASYVTAVTERALSWVATVTPRFRALALATQVEWNTLKSVGLHPEGS
ncbi:hypothetical protein Are01nite_81930 [Actinoplanes regularis]|nr:hypothetical protein Are01nite_81930 [Actinoplanes regularis]